MAIGLPLDDAGSSPDGLLSVTEYDTGTLPGGFFPVDEDVMGGSPDGSLPESVGDTGSLPVGSLPGD